MVPLGRVGVVERHRRAVAHSRRRRSPASRAARPAGVVVGQPTSAGRGAAPTVAAPSGAASPAARGRRRRPCRRRSTVLDGRRSSAARASASSQRPTVQEERATAPRHGTGRPFRSSRARSLPTQMRMEDPTRCSGPTRRPSRAPPSTGGVVRRAWAFARPYRWCDPRLPASSSGSTPCSAWCRRCCSGPILDTAIPEGDSAGGRAGHRHGARRARRRRARRRRSGGSAPIGEGLIFDLRVALFDKVQRMPIAFFTRTQTGALDQPAEQRRDRRPERRHRHARLGRVATSSCSSPRSPRCSSLEWRLTLLALVVLPLFIIPAKRVGRALQAHHPRAAWTSTPR